MSGVVGFNKLVVFLEFKESVSFLFLFTISFCMLNDPFFKGSENLSLVSGDQSEGVVINQITGCK